MAEPELPEDIIVRILERLPIKPLIRFSCLSKRWRYIILFDKHFAKSQFQIACQQQTLSRRILFGAQKPNSDYEFGSVKMGDNNSSSSSCSLRKLGCQFIQPGDYLRNIGSSNGLVCLLLKPAMIYIWNPSTGLYKKLPCPCFPPKNHEVGNFGFSYVSSADDYKIFVSVEEVKEDSGIEEGDDEAEEVFMTLSLRANIWNKIEKPKYRLGDAICTLLNEALHWDEGTDVVAFDLAKEEFRNMPLPISLHEHNIYLGVSVGGCLCLLDFNFDTGFADVWFMREYDVADSWTKQFTINISDQHSVIVDRFVSVMDSCTFVNRYLCHSTNSVSQLIRSDHEEEKVEILVSVDSTSFSHLVAIEYQETLLWLS